MDAVEHLTKTIDKLIIIDLLTTERYFNTFNNSSNIGKYYGKNFLD
jgi:hypothetical protein